MSESKSRYILSDRTLELAEVLLALPWFENVGQPLDAPHAAKRVLSLDEAIQHFGSEHWDTTLLCASNGLSSSLAEVNSNLFDKTWNEIVYAFNGHFEERFKALYEQLVAEYGLPRKNLIQFMSVIRHACHESEYIDSLPLGFFSEIISWYMSGNFPCGFEGEYPNGVLLVH